MNHISVINISVKNGPCLVSIEQGVAKETE
jgi:hypothetical protein